MKISIVTATFNSGKTLRDTIESVKAQSYQDFEMIIQDGGSKDNTFEIVKEYQAVMGDKLRWFQEKDNGLYDAMNRGIGHTTGDVVGILNSDDLYCDSDVLMTIAKQFQKDPELDCIYGDLVFVNADNIMQVERHWVGSQYKKGMFRKGWAPAHPTFYAKKECFEKYGAFKTDFEISADFELMLRFIAKNGVKNKYVPRNFVRMRLGGESTGSVKKIMLGNKNIRRAFRENGYKVSIFYTFRRLLPKALHVLKMKVKRMLGIESINVK